MVVGAAFVERDGSGKVGFVFVEEVNGEVEFVNSEVVFEFVGGFPQKFVVTDRDVCEFRCESVRFYWVKSDGDGCHNNQGREGTCCAISAYLLLLRKGKVESKSSIS